MKHRPPACLKSCATNSAGYNHECIRRDLQDEREGLVGALRNEAKAAGVPDTPEAGLEFLISKIKSNLHIALCFSPVGDIFRIRESLCQDV